MDCNCDKCIHYDVCKDLADTLEMEGCICNHHFHFKDKSRFIELPCNVGDTVYWLDKFVDDKLCAKCENYYAGGMGDCPVCKKTRYGFRFIKCIEIAERVASKDFILRYYNDFGKTLFLTKEEAEKALKELMINENA